MEEQLVPASPTREDCEMLDAHSILPSIEQTSSSLYNARKDDIRDEENGLADGSAVGENFTIKYIAEVSLASSI